MRLHLASWLFFLTPLALGYQSVLNRNLDFCPPSSFRSPFDLSCSPSISPELELAHNIHASANKPQEVLRSSIQQEDRQTADSVWTIKPRCLRQQNATERYCVYTSHKFANGRGISIFMRSDSTGELLNLPAFVDEHVFDSVNVEPNPPYIQKKIPNKGLGLVATRPIKRGEHIFSTTPVLLLEEEIYDSFRADDRYPFYHLAVKQLPKASAKLFNDLMGHFGGDPVEDIVNTNCFAVEMFGETRDGQHVAFNAVLPEVSRMNHACRPNAHYYFDPTTLIQHVHALRTIIPGEELTISYIDPLQSRAARLDSLHTSWGFPCDCQACTATDVQAKASDARISKALKIDEILQDTSANNTAATPELASLLVDLYTLENLLGPISDAYTLAALEYSGHGRKEEALRYAYKAIESGLLYSGPLDQDVKTMQELVLDVEKHWSWKIRERRRKNALEKGDEEVVSVVD